VEGLPAHRVRPGGGRKIRSKPVTKNKEDKYENEYLIQWGWPEDLFFHVDDLSSAHIYLRTPFTYDLSILKNSDDLLKLHPIPDKVIQECLQLCKYNSIEGNKKSQVDMIITPWFNLRKSMDMDVGTIGFTNEKLVLKIKKIFLVKPQNWLPNKIF